MEIQGKVWGSTSVIFDSNNTQISRLEGKAGAHCSIHKHDQKHSKIFVERGKLKVRIWKNDYGLVDVTTLTTHQATVVRPGEYHRFEVVEDTIAYEIYWAELDNDDIIRKDCGGTLAEAEADKAEEET